MTLLKLAFWISVVSAFLGVTSPLQRCDHKDSSALIDFAGELINGSVKSLWSNRSDCCGWRGVFCETNGSSSSRVTMVRLPGEGLVGNMNVSRFISGLDQLKILDLSNNSLEGELPLTFNSLKQLQVLDLSSNMLSGSPFSAISRMNSIRSLNLSANFFKGNLSDLGIFPNLVALNISNNFIGGQLNFRNCCFSSTTRSLDLSSNQFTGGLEGISYCSNSLELLHLDSNDLTGYLPDSLYSLALLQVLSISGNYLSGFLSHRISNLANLTTLVLSGNGFSGSIPDVFGNLTELETLSASSNQFTGLVPLTLSYCSKLQVLDLRNNSLSGTIDLNFSGLPNLQILQLSTNHFYGMLPESLSSCQQLTTVNLASNNFTGEIPASYANLGSLTFLSLSKNFLVNIYASLSAMMQCKKLAILILTKNFHGEEIPQTITGSNSLSLLALGNCGLRGQIPDWLANCSNLQVLDLSWNFLEGGIPPWIDKLEGLFYLDLSNNSLTGSMPVSITELKGFISATIVSPSLSTPTGIPLYVKRNQSVNGLQYNQASSFPPSIILSDNQITGEIWPDIGRLRHLHVLDLSRNNITGTIPSSIANMVNLETLDLSYNDLHGSIPSSFNVLTFLSKFSVAYNQLAGPIPTGGQFLSFPNSSFEGNPGLCGTLLSSCSNNTDDNGTQDSPAELESEFGKLTIIGITISVTVAFAVILVIIFLKRSRKIGIHVEDEEETDTNTSSKFTDATYIGYRKFVLFKNADCQGITAADLLKATNNFSPSNIVGCGGFGLVYKADLPDGTKAAIKKLSGNCGQIEREFQAEVEALSKAQHKNLVSLQGYCLSGNERLLIYSYMENGSLDYWLHERIEMGTPLNWATRLKIAQGAARGLAYLHKEPNIIHRDIKTSNILLDEKFEAHLADFGLARLLPPYDTHVSTDLVGTLGYIPPEYGHTLAATFRGDVYSFGIVLLELLTGRRPVEIGKGKTCRDLVAWVYQRMNEKKENEIFESCLSDKSNEKQMMEVLRIACKCIEKEPKNRPSIDDVVSLLETLK